MGGALLVGGSRCTDECPGPMTVVGGRCGGPDQGLLHVSPTMDHLLDDVDKIYCVHRRCVNTYTSDSDTCSAP